jgi:hypothetical protein
LCINFGKNSMDYILGDFFHISSGHPASLSPSAVCWSVLPFLYLFLSFLIKVRRNSLRKFAADSDSQTTLNCLN